MGDPTSRRKAYKLKSPVTRDSFLTWDLNHQSFCRQDPAWRKFLPGGTSKEWLPYDEDDTRGIKIWKETDGVRTLDGDGNPILDTEATDKQRSALTEFLVCLGTYCPENFMHTVVAECTSYQWVINKIKTTFNLETKGLGFLAGGDIKIDFGEEGQSYQQGFQAIKEFYCSSLLKVGDKYKGKPLDKNEPMTPFGENVLVEKWLNMINPDLRAHIMKTRGHLFTDERPNLFDNQKQLCEQMDVLLHELDTKKEGPGMNRAGFGFQGGNRPFTPRGRGGKPGFGNSARYTNPMMTRFNQPATGRANSRGSCPPDTCIRCHEAGRFGPASKNHFARTCPYPANPINNRPMRVLLIPSQQSGQDHTTVQEVQLSLACCSRHKLDTTDLTRLDQARERLMETDLRRRILLILMQLENSENIQTPFLMNF